MTEGAPGPVRVAAAVIRRGGRVLMTRRPPGGPFGLKWEFPGGKLEPGESAEQALVRELQEELGVAVAPRGVLRVERHRYDHGLSVELHFVACALDADEFTPSPAVCEVRWVLPSEVDASAVLEADRSFLAWLAESERGAADGGGVPG